MKTWQLLILAATAAGMAFGADIQVAAPEVGLDAPTVAATIGLLSGGLLIMRARRRK